MMINSNHSTKTIECFAQDLAIIMLSSQEPMRYDAIAEQLELPEDIAPMDIVYYLADNVLARISDKTFILTDAAQKYYS